MSRRYLSFSLLSLFGQWGCRRLERYIKREATMKHEPWLLTPEGVPPAGGWPVLVFFHGQGEAAWTAIDGDTVEQGPEAMHAHGSPVALYRAKDPRVETLWKRFALVAPQAFNEQGPVTEWSWAEGVVRERAVADIEQSLRRAPINADKMVAAAFSRGGPACYVLDGATPRLQFRKVATVDAQDLYALPAVVARQREVRAYYAPSTFHDIRDRHLAAEKQHGQARPPISIIARPQSGTEGVAHSALSQQVFAEDELYQWLLG